MEKREKIIPVRVSLEEEKTLLEKYGVKKINSEVAKYSQFYRKILINKQKNV